MIIIHKIDNFLFNLFPKAKQTGNSSEILKEELIGYYTFGPYKPKVEFDKRKEIENFIDGKDEQCLDPIIN